MYDDFLLAEEVRRAVLVEGLALGVVAEPVGWGKGGQRRKVGQVPG